MAKTIGALVLAGGNARRAQGKDKALFQYENMRFLDRLASTFSGFPELLLSTNRAELAENTPFRPVSDIVPDCGPLGGICSALTVCKSDGLVVAACDMPLFSAALAHALADDAETASAIACIDRAGRFHPLCAVYMRDCLPILSRMLSEKRLRMMEAFSAVGGKPFYLKETNIPDSALTNINTLDELHRLENKIPAQAIEEKETATC